MILYEYPFTERIRTLLRLEDLFDRLEFFMSHGEPQMHHVVLTTFFEILDVAGRADLKSDLLQELERQRQALSSFRNNPGVDEVALERILGDIENATTSLMRMQGRTGQHVRDHDWLTSIRSRSIIPGGTCEFDLPSYHAWMHRAPEARLANLNAWIAPLHPLRDCLRIVLRLLRDSGQATRIVAAQGSFQQMLGGKSYHMLQVRLDDSLGAIPEISANRYMIWVRFTTQDDNDLRARPFEGDVPFELVLCNL